MPAFVSQFWSIFLGWSVREIAVWGAATPLTWHGRIGVCSPQFVTSQSLLLEYERFTVVHVVLVCILGINDGPLKPWIISASLVFAEQITATWAFIPLENKIVNFSWSDRNKICCILTYKLSILDTNSKCTMLLARLMWIWSILHAAILEMKGMVVGSGAAFDPALNGGWFGSN